MSMFFRRDNDFVRQSKENHNVMTEQLETRICVIIILFKTEK